MDGNLGREGMTADLEAMDRVGIGGGIFLEVDLGIPRGTVGFMSPAWRECLVHAHREARRLGLELALGSGPGWCGTGGPWVEPEHAMQHLVASETRVQGPSRFSGPLPRPQPIPPFFGEGTFTPETRAAWRQFYRDVAVLAFPTPAGDYRLPGIQEKALFHRAPYSSAPGVMPRLSPDTRVLPDAEIIAPDRVLDLSGHLSGEGNLDWEVPAGNWTLLRLGRTLTGQVTRPAPRPGLGFESDKFDAKALDRHLADYLGRLLESFEEPPAGGPGAFQAHPFQTRWAKDPLGSEPSQGPRGGFTTLHFDSWEMSSQNWSAEFPRRFRALRGYDPLPYLPVLFGHPVGGVETAERFLWDLRRTAQQLVLTEHVEHLRAAGRRLGMAFSAEPYDMNPAGDLLLGGVADVPMGEFWSRGLGFSTEYSCFEAVSAGHTGGRRIIGAEAFTSTHDQWRQHPGSMKDQGDWALCTGINRLVFHRFQHQPTLNEAPGMTFGYTHGVHWERTQTWWELSGAYHRYLARCQELLRHGLPVADILYLDIEDAPAVFTPPSSALKQGLPDGLGHRFDGCAPDTLLARAQAREGRLVFPDGMTYRLLVLPRRKAMSPALLEKIASLARAGVPILGRPPERAPGLAGYPGCDETVRSLAREVWALPSVTWDPPAAPGAEAAELYPDYPTAARLLQGLGLPPDLESDADLRFAHRRSETFDLYFVGNRSTNPVSASVTFRVAGRSPELWDPLDGAWRSLARFQHVDGRTRVSLRFAPGQSYFVVFPAEGAVTPAGTSQGPDFPDTRPLLIWDHTPGGGDWEVFFDPHRGGPVEAVRFDRLQDWTSRGEDGIRHYSGRATYSRSFDLPGGLPPPAHGRISLGSVQVMARVVLNGHNLGEVWCPPFEVAIPEGVLRERGNRLEIQVANLWPNRLIGDAALPPERRVSRTTWNPYKPDAPLLPSGLLGPVRLLQDLPPSRTP